MGFKAFSACAVGSGEECKDQIISEISEAFGEVLCNCSADYGMVAELSKAQTDERGYFAECARLTGGHWDEATGAGPMLDNCQNGRCMCQKVYDVRVPVYKKIKIGSSVSASHLKQLVGIAGETCDVVSVNESKTFKNTRCIYHSLSVEGSLDSSSCIIDQGSGKCVDD